MKAELKAKWIAALRSGTYPQGRQSLRSAAGSYCCLGVLCEVTAREFDGAYYDFGYNDEGDQLSSDAELPPSVQRGLGLFDFHGQLIAMNDGDPDRGIEPLPFAEIADWIEEHIPAEE